MMSGDGSSRCPLCRLNLLAEIRALRLAIERQRRDEMSTLYRLVDMSTAIAEMLLGSRDRERDC